MSSAFRAVAAVITVIVVVGTAPKASGAERIAAPKLCPTPSGGAAEVTPAQSGASQPGPIVPTGAIRLRLCPGVAADDIAGRQFVPPIPPDTLVRHVDRVVSRLNSLNAYNGTMVLCQGVFGDYAYDVILGYPNGRQVVAHVNTGSCGRVQVGAEHRWGGAPVITLALRLIAEQRLASHPPVPIERPACPPPSRLATHGPGEIPHADIDEPPQVPLPGAVATACRFDLANPALPVLIRHAPVTSGLDELRMLVNGTVSQRSPHCFPLDGRVDVLVFATRGGDLFEVRVGRGACRLWFSWLWHGPVHHRLAARLDALLGDL